MDQFYLGPPIAQLLERCVEHGIWTALRSAADHLQRIGKSRQKMAPLDGEAPEVNGFWFAYWLLGSGLASATLVFVVEHVLGKFCAKMGPQRWRRIKVLLNGLF